MNLKKVCLIICVILVCADSFSQIISGKDSIVNKKYLLMHLQTLSSDAFEGRKTGTE